MFDPTIPIKIFTSYAHKDEPMRQELDTHLAMIRRHEAVDIWNDREIDAGEEWDAAIRKEFEEADIIMLLFSPSFLGSRYIYEKEMVAALQRHEERSAVVFPIILRRCEWRETEFRKLQVAPRDVAGERKPIKNWDDSDEAYYTVAQELKRVIKSVQARKKAAAEKG
ncbi:MAG: toll/interleukin-1 receptor domain-containing protein [Bacteroidota bacterium]